MKILSERHGPTAYESRKWRYLWNSVGCLQERKHSQNSVDVSQSFSACLKNLQNYRTITKLRIIGMGLMGKILTVHDAPRLIYIFPHCRVLTCKQKDWYEWKDGFPYHSGSSDFNPGVTCMLHTWDVVPFPSRIQSLKFIKGNFHKSPQTEGCSLFGVFQDVTSGHKRVVTTKTFPVSH